MKKSRKTRITRQNLEKSDHYRIIIPTGYDSALVNAGVRGFFAEKYPDKAQMIDDMTRQFHRQITLAVYRTSVEYDRNLKALHEAWMERRIYDLEPRNDLKRCLEGYPK